VTASEARLQLGAHVEPGGVRFAAFTRAATCAVELVDDGGTALLTVELEPRGDGYFQRLVPEAKPGSSYFFVVDGRRLPDPYARCLPRGVHGPATVVSTEYEFRYPPPRPLSEQVIYELHIGTFTEEGTFDAARGRLPELVDLGITTLELMPIAAFAGERGWGYDGVALFAPHAAYGTPDALRELLDAAHALGLSVLLDVVYNHFGPAGNYLAAYAPSYFRSDSKSPWGDAPNFEDPVLRGLVLDNAHYWLRELGFDGLRIDAAHALIDASPKHILTELAELAHELSPRRWLIAEDDRNLAELVTEGGVDALWADDFHHQVRVTLGGERTGYYAAFEPSAQGVADAINRGWLYAGQVNPVTGKARGSSAELLPAHALVYCIQNHDQIGNRALGDRLDQLTGDEAFRAASLLLLFLPMTPLLFMGQEWAASTPFLYFTDHDAELGARVTEGRRREFAAFHELAGEIPDPQARATFERSKLCWGERELPRHRATLELYRAALALRRTDPVLCRSRREDLFARALRGALVVQRSWGDQIRILVLNFGPEPVELESLAQELGLRAAFTLLESSEGRGSTLAVGGAIVLGGEEDVAETLEVEA
jgi:maltooligosyltrehalose trehalohydrolase